MNLPKVPKLLDTPLHSSAVFFQKLPTPEHPSESQSTFSKSETIFHGNENISLSCIRILTDLNRRHLWLLLILRSDQTQVSPKISTELHPLNSKSPICYLFEALSLKPAVTLPLALKTKDCEREKACEIHCFSVTFELSVNHNQPPEYINQGTNQIICLKSNLILFIETTKNYWAAFRSWLT